MSGKLLSPGLYDQIVAVVRSFLRTSRIVESVAADTARKAVSGLPRHKVILDKDIDGTTNPLIPSGNTNRLDYNATILVWSESAGEWKQTAGRLGVCVESDEDWSKDDCGFAEPVAGRYVMAGCPMAVSDRETPPWEESE